MAEFNPEHFISSKSVTYRCPDHQRQWKKEKWSREEDKLILNRAKIFEECHPKEKRRKGSFRTMDRAFEAQWRGGGGWGVGGESHGK